MTGNDIAIALREVEDSIQEFDHGAIPTKRFDIVLINTGERVGGISLRHVENEYLTLYRGHTGFKVDEQRRRRGYAVAALRHVLSIADSLGMRRLVATCSEGNVASERTILKAGLRYEATVDTPEHTYLWKHGIKRVLRFSKEFR